jgi:hypothetical protein
VVDREAWEVVDRFSVPAREIYDIVLGPAELARSVRRSARRANLRQALTHLLPKLGASLT